MKPIEHHISPPLPDVGRVLWRAGTPASKAGVMIREAAEEGLALLERTMRPRAQSLTGEALPECLCGFFGTALEGARNVTVLMATLGREVDDRLEALLSSGQLLRAHMLNSAASEAVELLAAAAQLETGRDFPGMEPTARLAPGYGGVPLAVQARMVSLFPDMGVSCSESFYLLPSKTITGGWGWVRRR